MIDVVDVCYALERAKRERDALVKELDAMAKRLSKSNVEELEHDLKILKDAQESTSKRCYEAETELRQYKNCLLHMKQHITEITGTYFE